MYIMIRTVLFEDSESKIIRLYTYYMYLQWTGLPNEVMGLNPFQKPLTSNFK